MKASSEQQEFLNRMSGHIIEAASIAAVPYDKDRIRDILDAYGDFFSRSAVIFVTNTRPDGERTLSVSYVDCRQPHDPVAIARANGFIVPNGDPIHRFLDDIRSQYPLSGYGVDLEVNRGLTKIWAFLQTPRPVEEFFSIPSLPDSVKDHKDYFHRHRLRFVSHFALDYYHLSANIYFMIRKPGQATTGKMEKMVGELGLEIPERPLLDYCKYAVAIYPTFNWQSRHAERLCMAVAASGAQQVPTHLHPLLESFTRDVPILSPERGFIYGVTPGRKGLYIKIANDYTGTMIKMMMERAQAIPEERKDGMGTNNI